MGEFGNFAPKLHYAPTFNLAVPFLGLFQKIYHHKYKVSYTYKVIQVAIVSNKGLKITQKVIEEQLNKLQQIYMVEYYAAMNKTRREMFLGTDVISRTESVKKVDVAQGTLYIAIWVRKLGKLHIYLCVRFCQNPPYKMYIII